MFVCRLFRADRPFEQIEARLLSEGRTTVGRAGDWSLPDDDSVLSRIHCILEVEGGRLFLRDKSKNGTFLSEGERAPFDVPVEIAPRQTLRLGPLSILVDDAKAAFEGAGAHVAVSTTVGAPRGGRACAPAPADGSLMEAFCQGAGLDASALSSRDPVELMLRLGEIYRETVLGLAALMSERTKLKGEYELDRTTIGAVSNNPFKWMPARSLAQELLCGEEGSFLAHADAVRASFDDLARHVSALQEGASAAARFALQTLAPDDIEAEAKAQNTLFRNRLALCWEIHNRRHAGLTGEGEGAVALRRAFSEAYGQASDTSAR